jgi:tetratricopeptide (TPR) repeat protein
MTILIIIIVAFVILSAVLSMKSYEKVRNDNLDKGGLRNSYPVFIQYLTTNLSMTLETDTGRSFTFSKAEKDFRISIGIKLDLEDQPTLFSRITNDFDKLKGLDILGVNFNDTKSINDCIIRSIEDAKLKLITRSRTNEADREEINERYDINETLMDLDNKTPKIPYEMLWGGEYDRTDPEVSYHRGRIAYSHEDYERAIDELRHAINLKPDYLDAHLLLGNSYKASKKYDSAIYAFEQASEFISNKDIVKSLIGTVYDLQERYEDAIKYYTEAIVLNPEEFSWYNFRADARFKLKHYSLAFFDYTKVLELKPDRFFQTQKQRATCRLYLRDYLGAIDEFNRSFADHPQPDGEAYYNRGLAFYHAKKINEFRNDMQTSLKLGYEKAAKYVKTTPKISIEQIRQEVNQEFEDILKTSYKTMEGTGMEGVVVYTELAKGINRIKEKWNTRKTEHSLTESQIDSIVDETFQAITNKYLKF